MIATVCVAYGGRRKGVRYVTIPMDTSRGRFYAFGALSDDHCASKGAAVAGFIASAVTERSKRGNYEVILAECISVGD